MKFKIQHYKYLKIKNCFKNINFFLIFNGINFKNFGKIDQKIKKYNIKYFKIQNVLTQIVLSNSIYINYKFVINGLTFIVKPNKIFINLSNILKLTGIKINNKIYKISRLNISTKLDYKSNSLIFLKLIKLGFKNFYKVIFSKQCDLNA